MAAPMTKTINNMDGKWVMNKTLSDSLEPALALQGVSWIARQAVDLVSVALHVKQFQGQPLPPSASSELTTIFDVGESIAGVLGMERMAQKSSTQFCLDSVWRGKKDMVFGSVRSRCCWISADEIDDPFLRGNWLEGEEEAAGPEGESHVSFHVESVGNGWTGTQIWGFQTINGERRHVRNILVRKGVDSVRCRVVYDYVA